MNIPVSCNKDCGAGCPLTATVENSRIIKISDSDKRGEWMSGCGRGYRSHKFINHPDRLKTPMIKDRSTGVFHEASWDAAINFTVENLKRVKDEWGASAVLHLGGGGACRGALHNTGGLTRRFLSLFGGCTTASDTYSSSASSFAVPYIFGTGYCGIDAATLTDSKFIFMPGANIADVRFGSELFNILKDLRKKGIRMTVVDPRKTRTVTGLDAEWIKIRPGTDTAFIAAVIHELLEHGGADEAFIDKYTHGFDGFRNWLYEAPVKNAAWASEICGCPAAAVKSVADGYRLGPAALLPGLSIQRNLGGEDAARIMTVLQAVTANIGRKGGSSGIITWGGLPGPGCGKIGLSSKSAGAEVRYTPIYIWPDLILDKSYNPPIKAVYNCGGNYLVQGGDTKKSLRAWDNLEFSVTHELFMTPTALASDVVFPVADYLERNDIVFAEGNFLLYSQKAVEPPSGVKTDYEIYSLLADRMGFGDDFTIQRTEQQWLDYFLSKSDVDDHEGFKQRGIWFGADNKRIAFTDFIRDPDEHPLNTPSGKIEISSESYFEAGGSLFPVYSQTDSDRSFRLITPHSGNRINSQYIILDNADTEGLSSKAKLLINRDDAVSLGIKDGSMVKVTSDTGKLEVMVELSSDIISGTVCLDCSYSNILTTTIPTLPSKGSRTHSTFVDIKPS